MSNASLAFTFEDEALLHSLGEIERIVRVNFATKAATLVKEYVEEEGGAVTPRLASGWRIYGYGDTYTRHVRASKSNWWAHFLAGGTRPHGPRSAPYLIFTIDGNTIHASSVRGVAATHFDQKAVDRARSRMGELLHEAIREAGL